MRLWTIQERAVLRALQETGRLAVPEDRGHRGPAPHSFRWLAERLPRVIPGHSGGLPWWLHTGPVRRWKDDEDAGSTGRDDEVVLELDVPRELAFVMPRWAWERILVGEYLALSRLELLRWRRAMRRAGVGTDDVETWLNPDPAPLPAPLEAMRRSSYERIFDPGFPARPWRRASRHGHVMTRGTEAVVEALELSWLRNVHEPLERPR